MAQHPSALKRHRQSEKRRARNTAARSTVRTAVKAARKAAAETPAEAAALIKAAQVELARSGAKGTFHKRNIARRIGRLQLLQNKLAKGQSVAATGKASAASAAPAPKKPAAKKPAAAKAAKK